MTKPKSASQTCTPARVCLAKTRSGQPCRARPLPSGLCWRHDNSPTIRAKRKAAERLGGRLSRYTGGESVDVKTLEGIRLQLCKVLGALWVMDNSISRTRAIVALCGELRATIAEGEIEARIAALERIVAERLPETKEPSGPSGGGTPAR